MRVGALAARGQEELARKDIRDELGLSQSQWMRSYTAIFQGMREDQPGGAPQVPKQFKGVFRRIQHGRFTLTEVGRRRARELSSAGRRQAIDAMHPGAFSCPVRAASAKW